MRPWLRNFLAGMLVNDALRSLHQDILGKDAVVQMTQAGWLSWKITVPLAMAYIVFAAILLERKP